MAIFAPKTTKMMPVPAPHNQILSLCTRNDGCTVPQVAEALDISVGTAIKYITTLVQEGYLENCGKTDSASGRRPQLYRLRGDAGCFLGLDLNDRYIRAGLMDFRGSMLHTFRDDEFTMEAYGSFDRMCDLLRKAIAETTEAGRLLKGVCIALPGRIDSVTGDSYTWFHTPGQSLVNRLHEIAGVPLSLYNDSRAMTWGEFLLGAGAGCRSMLMINVNWGLGMGIVIDSLVYGGKSGFAGEFGHVYGFDNQVICRCGKRGCNETEISGQALQRILLARIRAGESSILSPRVLSSEKPLTLEEIMDAIRREDVLCIEAVEQIGLHLGEKTAGLINLFNPELVVVGGELAMTGDYLLGPMRMAVNRHAIHLVSQDTRIVRSALGMDAGMSGACLIARSRYIGERFEC